MPQRFLKPGLITSPKWESCSWHAQSFYVRILTLVDDFGRYDAEPILLKSHAFPIREDVKTGKVEELCGELQGSGLVEFYIVAGKRFLQVTNWTERARSEKSRFPDPIGPDLSAAAESCGPLRNPAESCLPRSSFIVPRSSTNGEVFAPLAFPEKFSSDEFHLAWSKWESHRRAIKKAKDFRAMFQEQLSWLEQYDEATATEVLLTSVRNGWQGLFPPKGQIGNKRKDVQL